MEKTKENPELKDMRFNAFIAFICNRCRHMFSLETRGKEVIKKKGEVCIGAYKVK